MRREGEKIHTKFFYIFFILTIIFSKRKKKKDEEEGGGREKFEKKVSQFSIEIFQDSVKKKKKFNGKTQIHVYYYVYKNKKKIKNGDKRCLNKDERMIGVIIETCNVFVSQICVCVSMNICAVSQLERKEF